MNIGRFASLLMLAVCFGSLLHAQENFWDNADAYLGEARPSDTPKIFAPGLLADDGTFVMGRVAFSKDGKEFYYTQNDSWKSGKHAKIKMVRYADHHWSKPASSANNSSHRLCRSMATCCT